VTLKSGTVRRVFVDAASGLVVKTASSRKVRGHEVFIEVTYGDYQKTGGVAFPRSMEMGMAGRPQHLRIVVDTVEVNKPLDPARFRLTP
jgi:hypothetical protein